MTKEELKKEIEKLSKFEKFILYLRLLRRKKKK